MNLTSEEKSMLAGERGRAAQKAMEILVALGSIFGADRLVPVGSAQVAGVSYLNLGDEGLEFLEEMAADGRVRVLSTLNPAGMDLEAWRTQGIPESFAERQSRVIAAFRRMGITPTCTCTPYLAGNTPGAGEHIAWSESSAVCYANSVLGARTNREGGPAALAAALAGRTPLYGLHLDENRQAQVRVDLRTPVESTYALSVLGSVVGRRIGNRIPLFTSLGEVGEDGLKSLGAALATFGGTALFHVEGTTLGPWGDPKEVVAVDRTDMAEAAARMDDVTEADLVSIGCPHAGLDEIRRAAELLRGKQVRRPLWITTSRPVKEAADRMGYAAVVEEAGALLICDTCVAVAPLKGTFHALATDSSKMWYYGQGMNRLRTRLLPTEACLELALR